MFNPGAICRAYETLEPKRKATWRGRTGSETLPTGASSPPATPKEKD